MKNPLSLGDFRVIGGKKVLLRLDFNVPIQNGEVMDDFRIRQSIPIIDTLRNVSEAKIIILSHIESKEATLRPVYEHLKNRYPNTFPNIIFCEDVIENGKKYIDELGSGQVLLCENLRLYDGEKRNDEDFAKKLAELGDLYINDAFSVSHRKHASIVGIPKFLPSFMGHEFEREVENLSKAFQPEKPFVFILGGAKFETKMPLVERFLPLADTVFIGGAMANDFFKAQGLEIGKSKVSDDTLDLSTLLSHPKVILPIDVVVESLSGKKTKKPTEVTKEESILDAGEETLALLAERIKDAKTVIWNGPLGYYEGGFKEPTLELAKIIAHSKAYSILGGGDTLAAIAELGLEEKFGFVSTGGGAMLDFLADGSIPGLDALKK